MTSIERIYPPIQLPRDLEQIRTQWCNRITKQAYVSAGVAAVPVPLIDIVVDVTLLSQTLPKISQDFGLTGSPTDEINLRAYEIHYQELRTRAIEFLGMLMGRSALTQSIKSVAKRAVTKQMVRYVPVGGQAIAATLGYVIYKKVTLDHINECYRLASIVQKKQQEKIINQAH